MKQALLIRLKPTGPWRYGPGDGATDRVDSFFRSDRLFSAITLALQRLGHLDEWLDATARRGEPSIALTSLFPFQAETLFAPPPATLWPPPPALVTAPSPLFLSKLRWRAAGLVPVSAIESILIGQPLLADQWVPDPDSGCLLRRDRPAVSPFRTVVRSQAAVDRLGQGSVHPYTATCVEFEPSSGLWCAAVYQDEAIRRHWDPLMRAAFRLLADTGFGARRSSGWGQTADPHFQSGAWPVVLMPKFAARASAVAADNGATNGSHYWLLSLFTPASGDEIDWKAGDYQVTVRGGRIESLAGSGQKKQLRMIAEGSVVGATQEPIGAAVDVAPDGFAHPVYRAGLAVALKLPVLDLSALPKVVETTPIPVDEGKLDVSGPEPDDVEATAEPETPTDPLSPEPASDATREPAVPPPDLVVELSDETRFSPGSIIELLKAYEREDEEPTDEV